MTTYTGITHHVNPLFSDLPEWAEELGEVPVLAILFSAIYRIERCLFMWDDEHGDERTLILYCDSKDIYGNVAASFEALECECVDYRDGWDDELDTNEYPMWAVNLRSCSKDTYNLLLEFWNKKPHNVTD